MDNLFGYTEQQWATIFILFLLLWIAEILRSHRRVLEQIREELVAERLRVTGRRGF